MGSSRNRIRAYDLGARCCHGAFYALGFLTTILIVMAILWVIWCYFGLSIVQVSNSQRRAVVNYSITTAKPHTSTTSPRLHNQTSGDPSFESSLNTISKSVTTSSSFHRGSSRGESQLKSEHEGKDVSRGNTSLAKGDFAARDRAAPGAKELSVVSTAPQNSESGDVKTRDPILSGEINDDVNQTRRVASSNDNRSDLNEPIQNKDLLAIDSPVITPMKVHDHVISSEIKPHDDVSSDEKRTSSREYPKPERSSTSVRDEIQSTRRSDADTVSRDPNFGHDPPRTYVRERTRYDDDEDRGSRSRYDTRDRGRDRVRHTDDRYSKGDTRLYDGGRTIDDTHSDEKKSSYDEDRYDGVPRRRGDDDRIRDSDERYIYRDEIPRHVDDDPRYKSRDTRYEDRDEERYRTRDDDRHRLQDDRGYRLRNDKNDRTREDDNYRPKYEERHESRIDGRDRSRTDDRYSSKVDDRDRSIIDDRDRSIIDDRDRSRSDRRDGSRIDDKDDGSRIIEPDRSRIGDRTRDYDKDLSRDDDKHRTRVESVDRPTVDDRYETGYEDTEKLRVEDRRRLRDEDKNKSRDDDRYRTRGDDRDIVRDEDDYRPRGESRRRTSEDKFTDGSHQGTRHLERGRYRPRGEEDRYSDDTRTINRDYRDPVSSRTDALPPLDRSPLPVRKSSNVRGDNEETEYDYPSRGSVRSHSDGHSRTVVSETRRRDRDDEYRRPSRYDDRDRISPSRVGDDTHSTRSTSLDSRSRSEAPLPILSGSRHRDRYPEDRMIDTKYYDDEDRKRTSSSLEGSSRRSQDDDRREYRTRLPGERSETKHVDRGEEVVLDRRSYPSEEDDDYREKSNSRTGSYDGRTDTRLRGDDGEYAHRGRTDEEDEYPRRRKDDTDDDSEYPRRRKDDDEDFRHVRPREDTSRTQHRDSYDDYSRYDDRYDDERTVHRRDDIPRNRDEGLRKDEIPHRNTDDRPSHALDHVSSNARVPIGDRDMKFQDNRSPSDSARMPHRIVSSEAADSERIAPDSSRREYPGRSRPEERPLNAKDVIEAALRHSDLSDSVRKVSYPVFDPRVSNLTSPDVIRPSERRGSTIQSRRKRWFLV